MALASADEAAILEIEPGAPLMAITRTTTDADGEPIEFSRDLFRADRTRIVVRTEGAPPAPSPAARRSSNCAPRRRRDDRAEQPVGRVRFMDRQRVNLDGFAVEDPELGLTAMCSPHDPSPSLVVTVGRVTELDGVPEAEFDSIDTYIARHGLDLDVAGEAMSTDTSASPGCWSTPPYPGTRSSGSARVPPRPSSPGCWPCSARPSSAWP